MTTTKSRELLPCPFCGGEAKMSHSRDGEVCNVCCVGWSVGHCLGAGPNCYTEAEAVAGWNRRALPAGMEPVGYAHAGSLSNIGDGYAYLYPEQAAGASVPLYTAAQVRALLDAANTPSGSRAVLRALLRPGSGS